MRILIAEDHPDMGADLKEGLERHHYAVDLVADGEDALALALTIPYDLIVLDVMLPSLSGFDVCCQLRNKRRNMPILFLTALSDVDSRVTGLDMGGDDYLAKPFAFREFDDNALVYTPGGGHVLLRVEGDQKRARIIVRDTGEGIAAQHLPHIFERFYRCDPARKRREGSGLGLTIVDWVVRAHGGTIDVVSKVGYGSTFTVTIPVQPAKNDQASFL